MAPFLTTRETLSAEYCRVTSCHMRGSLKRRASESRSQYRSESHTTCMLFLYILTLPIASRKPILVLSIGPVGTSRESETATESDTARVSADGNPSDISAIAADGAGAAGSES